MSKQTVNVEQVLGLLAALAAQSAKPTKAAKANQPKRTKEETFAAIEAAARKKGFADAKCHVNLLTYGKWGEKGRVPRKGQHSLRFEGRKTGLFHVSQTDEVEPAKAS